LIGVRGGMAMKCGKCGTENADSERFCRDCEAPLHPFEKMLWDEIQAMYKNNKDRLGHASMFTAILTGSVLVITGLADVAESTPIPAKDWVLVIGGMLIPAALYVRWLLVESKRA